jgi:hypothetical protein
MNVRQIDSETHGDGHAMSAEPRRPDKAPEDATRVTGG